MSQPTKKQSKEFYGYECGNGPRPPVPGEESQVSKMTTEGAFESTSNPDRSPEAESSFSSRISRWQENLFHLLNDPEGLELLFKFVREEVGEDSKQSKQLYFYFACRGLKCEEDMSTSRKLIRMISGKFLSDNVIKVLPELRETISQIIARKIPPNPNVFDELQANVQEIMAKKLYPEFLKSETFIQFIEQNSRDTKNPTTVRPSTSSNSNINSNTTTSNTDGAANISGINVGLSPSMTTSNLQTLHEDAELTLNNEPISTKKTTDRSMQRPTLTRDRLLATQNERLEIRPQGPLFAYSKSLNPSYNTVSRQDSARQSCSSADLTDSDVNSKDGKPYIHRRLTPAEDHRKCKINSSSALPPTVLKSVSQGSIMPTGPSESRLEQAAKPFNPMELCAKLMEYQQQLDKHSFQHERIINVHRAEQFSRSLNERVELRLRGLPSVEDENQSILDQHVSRVFSPQFSPGTTSPKYLHRFRHHPNEMSSSMPDFITHPIRHSKSIPEQASSISFNKKISQKCPSANIDSGISQCSYYPPFKAKEMVSSEQLNEEACKLKEESRRQRKQVQQASSLHMNMPSTSSHHTNSLPRVHHDTMKSMSTSMTEDYTFAVYTFGDEKIPYRTKIPGKRLTLKHFKEYLPKKGNFRFFFTTTCDDPDSPIIQEEVINDADILPLYEGKIMGTLKSD